MANSAFEFSMLLVILLTVTFPAAAQTMTLMQGFKRAKSENVEFSGPNTVQRTLIAQGKTKDLVCGRLCSSPACIGFSSRAASPDTINCTLASNTSKVNQVATKSNAYWKITASKCVNTNDH